MKTAIPSIIGRVGTVLVFQEGAEAKAVLSWVIARAQRCRTRPKLKINGNVHPDRPGMQHLNRVVLPLVNRLATVLCLSPHNFELSFVQLGIASSMQRPLTLTGHSIDLPVFLAMLSALLKLAVPQDLVCTGHIGSVDGDVRMVAAVPEKLDAVLAGPGFRRFAFPHPDADASLRVLAPDQRQQMIDALAAAADRVQLLGIRGVEDLLLAVLDEEQMALAALRSGYFQLDERAMQESDLPLAPAALLCRQNAQRFWLALEWHLFAGRYAASRRLLSAFVHCHIRKKQYPTDFGLHLRQLRDSLPPAVRSLKLKGPLIAVDLCVALAHFAAASDAQDVQFLFQAINIREAQKIATSAASPPGNPSAQTHGDDAAVNALVELISPRSVAQRIDRPIDDARAAFALPTLAVQSTGELIDIISCLYLMFLRHCGEVSASSDPQSCRDDALRLLESAFASEGGIRAALAEARWPVRGGLLYIIGLCSERYKRERQIMFVERVIKEAIPTDWDERVRFTTAWLRKMDLDLPQELRDLPPDRLVNSIAEIVQTHVLSMEPVNRLLRSL